MKRLITGLVLVALAVLSAVGHLANSDEPQAEKGKGLVTAIVITVCGALTALAGLQSRRRISEVRGWVQSQTSGIDLPRLAAATGMSERLAYHYLQGLELPDGVMPSPPAPVHSEDSPWRRAFASRVVAAGTFLEIQLGEEIEALELVQPDHSVLWCLGMIVAVVVLSMPLLFLTMLAAIPGICFLTWRFASRWDWFRAEGIKPPVGTFIMTCIFSFAAGVGLLAALLPSYAVALVRTSARLGLVRHRGNDPLCAPQRISHEEIKPVRIEAIDTSSPAKTRYRISFENGRTKWYAARRRFAVRSTPDLERNQSLLEGKAPLAHQA